MTFNPDSDISSHRTRRPGRTAAIAGVGGVGLLGIIALIAGPLLGVDLTGLLGGGTQGGARPMPGETVLACESGKDARRGTTAVGRRAGAAR